MLDSKDRKNALKALKENMKDSFTNRMAHLFVIHVLSTLDDTTLLKKKIVAVSDSISNCFIQELLKSLDELINDKCYQNILMSLFTPKNRSIFLAEELEAFEAFKDRTSSKKPDNIRRAELLKMVMKPIEQFFEEHLQFYLLDINKNPLLRGLLKAIVEGK